MKTQPDYSITSDPIFYITVAVFALLTTGIPAILGQATFMSVLQTASLTFFLAMAVRKGQIKQAFIIILIWSIIQFSTILLVTWGMPGLVEDAIPDGFGQRGAYLKWFYTGGQLPGGMLQNPLARLFELIGISFGTLLTGGLLGVWRFVRLLSLAAFQTGTILLSLGGWLELLKVLPWWTLTRMGGYAAFLVVLSEPLLCGNWSPVHYWRERKQPLMIGILLIGVGMLLEVFVSAM